MKRPSIKICGVRTPDIVKASVAAGADFIGFVFYPKSPRFVQAKDAAMLVGGLPKNVKSVGLFVNPDDLQIEDILRKKVRLDMIQLHGSESPERVRAIKVAFGLPVIKAVPIENESDLGLLPEYESVADWLLFDKKSAEHGGTGQSFDWALLRNKSFKKPWMLSGGLTTENVEEALKTLSPGAVDVSSGVESVRGVKDAEKIRAFIKAVRNVPLS